MARSLLGVFYCRPIEGELLLLRVSKRADASQEFSGGDERIRKLLQLELCPTSKPLPDIYWR